MARVTGRYLESVAAGRAVKAFAPFPLPPHDPPLDLGAVEGLHGMALSAIERLELAGRMVPSTGWFLYGFVRKEALVSSQIEGTQATLRDVLTFEATGEASRPEDAEEVCNYVEALSYARRELSRSGGLPISTRLLCEAHRRLMRGVRGGNKDPGRIRSVQNWIGGGDIGTARFIPPPPLDVRDLMADLERWVHAGSAEPALIRAGLAHVQFETIHPFLDGNGRIGRLLVTLLLEHWNVLSSPLLYLSLAFKRHQSEYYARLAGVRTDGDWEGWTAFFLSCVREAAEDGIDVAGRLFELIGRDRRRVVEHGRSTIAAVRLMDLLPEHPIVTGKGLAGALRVAPPTARKAIEILVDAGVLREVSGKQRDRVFAYRRYLDVLTGGGE